jgi:hypothetical protein
VFNSYGRRDNRHLLMEYGFAIENNEWDWYGLQVSLMTADESCEALRRLFYQAHLPIMKVRQRSVSRCHLARRCARQPVCC